MSHLKITLEISSVAQVAALERALELYSEMEAERLKDHEKDPTVQRDARALQECRADREVQRASIELLKAIRGVTK